MTREYRVLKWSGATLIDLGTRSARSQREAIEGVLNAEADGVALDAHVAVPLRFWKPLTPTVQLERVVTFTDAS